MLPILRILPIGAVLVALLILISALTPPDGIPPALHQASMQARGPLIDRNEHPEWRPFIMQAAFERAEAVFRLFDLPNTPTKLPEIVVPLPEVPELVIKPAKITPEPGALPSEAEQPTVPSDRNVASLPATPVEPVQETQTSAPAIQESAKNPNPAPLAPAPQQHAVAPAEQTQQSASAPVEPLQKAEAPPPLVQPPPDAALQTSIGSAPATPAAQSLPAPADLPQPAANVPLPREAARKVAVPLPPLMPAALRKLAALPPEPAASDSGPAAITPPDDRASNASPGEARESPSTKLVVLPPERPRIPRKQRHAVSAKPLHRAKAQLTAHPRPRAQVQPNDILGQLFGAPPPAPQSRIRNAPTIGRGPGDPQVTPQR